MVVADIMTPRPTVVRRGTSVAEFVAHQGRVARGSSFPVVDDEGRLFGLMTFRRAVAVPRDRGTSTAVDDVAAPAHAVWTATPDERLLDVLARGARGESRIVVVDGDRVVGIVSPVDITQAMQRLGLQAALARGG